MVQLIKGYGKLSHTSVITNPITNIPKHLKSHTRGWTETWSNLMGGIQIDHNCSRKILNYDLVYIDHGVNFGGTLNLFGGANEELFKKINLLIQCKNVISLDIPMPDYGAMLKKRIGAKTTHYEITEDWCDVVSNKLLNCGLLRHEDLGTNSITIGDSHSTAFARSCDAVFRTNGKTLFGALKTGLVNELRNVEPYGDHINWCLGSIDIRHHILRYPNFDLKEFIQRYVMQADAIAAKFEGTASFCAPVPVEFEGRKLPKTGYYKGTPFYGTWDQRHKLTMEFIDILRNESNGRVVQPPKEWYTMNSELYAETFMELSGSVHLAPIYYRNKNWGQKNVFD